LVGCTDDSKSEIKNPLELPNQIDTNNIVDSGETVYVDYTGTFEDGETFDTSEGKGPLDILVGSGEVISGFDKALIGMEVNEEKNIVLQPSEAYGEFDPQRIVDVPKENLQYDDNVPKIGEIVTVQMSDGLQRAAIVQSVSEETIKLNFNHPLAGKVLNFKIKVIDIL